MGFPGRRGALAPRGLSGVLGQRLEGIGHRLLAQREQVGDHRDRQLVARVSRARLLVGVLQLLAGDDRGVHQAAALSRVPPPAKASVAAARASAWRSFSVLPVVFFAAAVFAAGAAGVAAGLPASSSSSALPPAPSTDAWRTCGASSLSWVCSFRKLRSWPT